MPAFWAQRASMLMNTSHRCRRTHSLRSSCPVLSPWKTGKQLPSAFLKPKIVTKKAGSLKAARFMLMGTGLKFLGGNYFLAASRSATSAITFSEIFFGQGE